MKKTPWSTQTPLLIEPFHKNYEKFQKQLEKNGFCDSETWSLDTTMSQFLLPRIQRFKKIKNGYPDGLTPKEWDEILDAIIKSLQWNAHQFETNKLPPKEYQKGFELLGKWFTALWW